MVDNLVDDLACTLGVGRDSLGIVGLCIMSVSSSSLAAMLTMLQVAAAKGLFAGSITLILRNSSVLSCGLVQENVRHCSLIEWELKLTECQL